MSSCFPGVTAKYMYHREFSFTVGEVYMRYLSFRNEAELRARLKAVCPHKIDIGAVYTLPVSPSTPLRTFRRSRCP